jgi:hypothetical protein
MALRLRQYADESYVVLSHNAEVGIIVHVESSVGREWWTWHMNMVGGRPVRGTADTREEAMRAFKAAWQAWVAEAGLVEVAPLNAGTPWTESAVSDLVASLEAGDDVRDRAIPAARGKRCASQNG